MHFPARLGYNNSGRLQLLAGFKESRRPAEPAPSAHTLTI
jgi:hypothetical protein